MNKRVVERALATAEHEVKIAEAQRDIIKTLIPLEARRREQLMRFMACAVENDCLHLIRTDPAPPKAERVR